MWEARSGQYDHKTGRIFWLDMVSSNINGLTVYNPIPTMKFCIATYPYKLWTLSVVFLNSYPCYPHSFSSSSSPTITIVVCFELDLTLFHDQIPFLMLTCSLSKAYLPLVFTLKPTKLQDVLSTDINISASLKWCQCKSIQN